MRIGWFALTILVALCGCQEAEPEGEPVAEAYGKMLMREDVATISFAENSEDSARIVDDYIENWMREQVLMEHAENFLTPDQKDFTEELEDYRKSLLLYALEEQVLLQKLDTVVTLEEMTAYYEQNAENFELKDYIVQVRFAMLPDSTADLDHFEALFYSESDEDIVTIQTFCIEAGGRYFLENDRWIYLDELLEQVPVQFFNAESFLKKNKKVSFVEANTRFFLHVSDYKLKDDVSPLEMEKENISNLILNKRKIDLLSKMRNDLYQDAKSKNKVRKY